MGWVNKASAPPQDQVKAAPAPVPPMGSADGSDARGMAGRRKPVMDRRADTAPLNRRVARPMMPGDEEDYAVAGIDCLLKRAVNHGPGAVEVKPVKIDHPIGRD